MAGAIFIVTPVIRTQHQHLGQHIVVAGEALERLQLLLALFPNPDCLDVFAAVDRCTRMRQQYDEAVVPSIRSQLANALRAAGFAVS